MHTTKTAHFLNSHFTGTSAFCPAPEPKSPSNSETFISCNGGANLCMNGVRSSHCGRVYTPVIPPCSYVAVFVASNNGDNYIQWKHSNI